MAKSSNSNRLSFIFASLAVHGSFYVTFPNLKTSDYLGSALAVAYFVYLIYAFVFDLPMQLKSETIQVGEKKWRIAVLFLAIFGLYAVFQVGHVRSS